MKRHVLDTPVKRTSSAMKLSFSKIGLANAPGRAALALHRRSHAAASNGRVQQYTRIDRGYRA